MENLVAKRMMRLRSGMNVWMLHPSLTMEGVNVGSTWVNVLQVQHVISVSSGSTPFIVNPILVGVALPRSEALSEAHEVPLDGGILRQGGDKRDRLPLFGFFISSEEQAQVLALCHSRESNVDLFIGEVAFVDGTARHGHNGFCHGVTLGLVNSDG